MVSFSADALVSIVTFVRNTFFGHNIPHTMASTRHVDDAIQFVLFWAPVLVLLGWIIDQPFSLLFDLFEVAILIGSCFLLNYVTEDSKTNWAEGTMLVALYLMVVSCRFVCLGTFILLPSAINDQTADYHTAHRRLLRGFTPNNQKFE